METFGKIVSVVILLIISPIVSAFVALKLYTWFLLPNFNLPELGIATMIGIIVFLRFVINPTPDEDDDDDEHHSFSEKIVWVFAKVILKAGLILFVGWIVSLFV